MPSTTRPASIESLPAIPENSSVRRIAFDDEALATIADELGQPLGVAPFQVRGRAVHRIAIPVMGGAVVPGAMGARRVAGDDQPITTLTLWTSMRRVDVTTPWVTVVATGVIAIDLVAGVEAIFRYRGGSVTVARNGRVMVRTGPMTDGHDRP